MLTINSDFTCVKKETVELDILITSRSDMIFPPDILRTRIKNTKLVSLATEAYRTMCWVTAAVSY